MSQPTQIHSDLNGLPCLSGFVTSVNVAGASADATLMQLRRLVSAASNRHQHGAAAWYAEKAVTLSAGADDDVYALASSYYLAGQYTRSLSLLENYGVIDADKHANVAASSSDGSPAGTVGAGTTKLAPPPSHAKPGRQNLYSNSAARGLSFVSTPGGPSTSNAASNMAAAPIQQLRGAVKPTSLRFFHLAALCHAAEEHWEQCILLLEAGMEGRGHAGLRVPLKPVDDESLQTLESMMASIEAVHHHHHDAVPASRAPAAAASTPIAPPSASNPVSDAIDGLDGAVPNERFYSTPAGQHPGGGSSSNGAASSVAGAAAASSDGLRVWATLQHMALQHSDAAAALSAAGRAESSSESSLVADVGYGWGYDCRVVDVVPQSLLALGSNSVGGHVPVSSGHRINLVAAMCQIRGEALLATDNRLRGAQWLLAALRLDPYCVEAFQLLVENHLLTDDEESRLLAYLTSVLGAAAPVVLGPAIPRSSELNHIQRPNGSLDHTNGNKLRSASVSSAAAASSGSAALGSKASVGPTAAGTRATVRSAAAAAKVATAAPRSVPASSKHAHYSSGIGPAANPLTRSQSTRSVTGTGGVASASTATGKGLTRGASMRGAALAAASSSSAAVSSAVNGGKHTNSRSRTNSAAGSVDALVDGTAAAGGSESSAASGAEDDEHRDLDFSSAPGSVAEPPDSSPPSSSSSSSIVAHVDNNWLLNIYGCRLNRYMVSSQQPNRTILAKFGPLESGQVRLGASLDVLAAKAENLLCQHDASGALALSRRVIATDPHHRAAAVVHYAALVDLRKAPELFQAAHAAVEAAPKDAMSWYAVGCYYICLGKFASAVRHLTKSIQFDASFAPAWMALSHAYAGQDENEPALVACRTAMRLYPASHMPPLAMAGLTLKAGSLQLAKQYLDMATARCAHDPGIYHEAGCLEYRQGNITEAYTLFKFTAQLLSQTPQHLRKAFESSYVNLGHSARKLGLYEEAIQAYSSALALVPHKPSTLAALAFTHHLSRNYDTACSLYHAALAKVPEDAFCNRMLRVALQDMLDQSSANGGEPAPRTGYSRVQLTRAQSIRRRAGIYSPGTGTASGSGLGGFRSSTGSDTLPSAASAVRFCMAGGDDVNANIDMINGDGADSIDAGHQFAEGGDEVNFADYVIDDDDGGEEEDDDDVDVEENGYFAENAEMMQQPQELFAGGEDGIPEMDEEGNQIYYDEEGNAYIMQPESLQEDGDDGVDGAHAGYGDTGVAASASPISMVQDDAGEVAYGGGALLPASIHASPSGSNVTDVEAIDDSDDEVDGDDRDNHFGFVSASSVPRQSSAAGGGGAGGHRVDLVSPDARQALSTPTQQLAFDTSPPAVAGGGSHGDHHDAETGGGYQEDVDASGLSDFEYAALLQQQELEEAHGIAAQLAASGLDVHIDEHGAVLLDESQQGYLDGTHDAAGQVLTDDMLEGDDDAGRRR